MIHGVMVAYLTLTQVVQVQVLMDHQIKWPVAQWSEQHSYKVKVPSSILGRPTNGE